MAPENNTKNIKEKLNNNQHNIGEFPREAKSIDENLMSVFRTMWNTNLLLKNMMNSIEVSEAKHNYKNCVQMDSTLKDLYKNIWKVNLLLKNMMKSIIDSEARHDYKNCDHMDSTLKDVHKTLWKLNSLLIYELRFQE